MFSCMVIGVFCGSFGRKLFDNFDPSSIAKFTDKKLLSLKASGGTLLSEPKLRAVIENANQMLKVIKFITRCLW